MMDDIQKLDEAGRLVFPSYVVVTKQQFPGLKALQCLICRGTPSWNQSHVSNRYCQRCDVNHDDIEVYLKLKEVSSDI